MSQERPVRLPQKAADRKATDKQAAWLPWSLQLVVGCLVGCGVGYQVWRLLDRGSVDELLLIAVGCGLVCGAVTSFYGNRAWMAGSIFMPSEAAPPRKARAWSLLIGGVGAVVVGLSLGHHIIAVATRERSHGSTGFDLFLVFAAGLPGFLLVHALRTGATFWSFGIIDREETPLIFWVYVVLNGVAMLSILSMAF